MLLEPLPNPEDVAFRQAVFRDLEQPALGGALRGFGDALAAVRSTLERTASMRHPAERDRWVLDALERHDAAVADLWRALDAGPIASAGLAAVRDHVAAFVASSAFRRRRADVAAARAALDGVRYRLRIGQQRVVVSRERGEPDLAARIRATLARLGDGAPAPLRVDTFDTLDMNPLQAEVLARVVRLTPEPFARLAATVAAHQPVVDPGLVAIAADAAWFLAVLDLFAALRGAGVGWCYPSVAADGTLAAEGLYELALARRMAGAGRAVAVSDVSLAPGERLAVVTGPSQGGRTTFARAVGQLHVLAAAGCPVPAASATVPLVDGVRTVFDRPERLDDPGGRLRGELRQVRSMLAATTGRTLVVANEPFASTTAQDALALSRELVAAVNGREARMLAVTFLEELAAAPGAVSLAAAVDATDPALRTFRFERRAADGLAYAQALAGRYGLRESTIRQGMTR